MGNLLSAFIPPLRYKDTYFTYSNGECYVVDKNGNIVRDAKGASGSGELFEFTREPVRDIDGDGVDDISPDDINIDDINNAITNGTTTSTWSVNSNCLLNVILSGTNSETSVNTRFENNIDMTKWESGVVYQIVLNIIPLANLASTTPEGSAPNLSGVDPDTYFYAEKSTVVLNQNTGLTIAIIIIILVVGALFVLSVIFLLFWLLRGSNTTTKVYTSRPPSDVSDY